ncbi:hypothetical protein [Sphingobacterium spiritivorum]|uniref:hypothetical protein n=2 Tax=Sphingobacterium spiritivorum TaxID=258 RepID=UPI003DA2EB6D
MNNFMLNKQREDAAMPANFEILIKEARVSGYWIYHKSAGKWYTPEEFQEVARELYSRERDGKRNNSSDFAVRDPYSGINDRVRWVDQMNTELQTFKKKIDEYFQVQLKKRK